MNFATTSHFNNEGDLWVSRPGGEVVKVEVKTASKYGWPTKERQIAAVSFFVFVRLFDAEIWVLTANEVRKTLAGRPRVGDMTVIDVRQFPPNAAQAWFKITGVEQSAVQVKRVVEHRRLLPTDSIPEGGRARVVRRKLADGSVREYRYLIDKASRKGSSLPGITR